MLEVGLDECPAVPVQSAENGWFTGQASPMRVLVACQTRLTDALLVLAAKIEAQTEAVQALAESNMMLVQAMAQDQGMDDAPPAYDMSGKPIHSA